MLETKESYLQYCKDMDVYNQPRKYGSTHTYIEDGIDRETYLDDGTNNYISTEPKSYPCIMVYGEYNDQIYGYFIYQRDFE